MTVKRYYSDTDRTRRTAGVILLIVGGLGLALVAWLALDGISTAVVLLAMATVILIALGVRFLRHAVAAFDVDLDQRRYVLIRDGKPAGSGALDELGPLRVTEEVTRIKPHDPQKMARTYISYKVKPAGFGFLSFYSMKSPGRARQKMEALARKWRVSCRSFDGPVREYEHLDAPIQVRLADDAEARTPITLDPAWRVGIEPIFRGHAIVSNNRSFEPLVNNAVFVVLPILVIVYARGTLIPGLRGMFHGSLFDQVMLAIAAGALCVCAWRAVHGVLDTFGPGAIKINDRGVAYRWWRMGFDAIEEVTAGQRIEIVGDRRVVTIPASFCPPAAVKPIAHEVQRLILEVSANRTDR